MTQPLHPAQLHAHAALHSLRAALAMLNNRAEAEAAAIRAEHAAAADPLKSPLWGRRHALGGHGDPTADAVDTIDAPRTNQWAKLEREVQEQILAVAEHLPSVGGFNPVARIEAALPAMSPVAADATRKLADRIDGRIRRLLHETDDRQLVPRVRCPTCDTVSLVMRTSPPLTLRVVECTTCDAAWWRTAMLGSAAT